VLIVDTTDISYPWVNGTGIPQSMHARIEERFSVSEDGSRLDYEMKYTDPLTYTEFITFTKAWDWRPGEKVRRFECTSAAADRSQ
jgi:hypothetical protein